MYPKARLLLFPGVMAATTTLRISCQHNTSIFDALVLGRR